MHYEIDGESTPALFRASMWLCYFPRQRGGAVDGRDKPGHDGRRE